jgi:hypothetical protein
MTGALFVDHFQNLSPEEQTIYLNRQGSIRFARPARSSESPGGKNAA